jgi:uncharacterized protein (DUF58 family)
VVAFLISDFLDRGYEQRLRVTARRHDLTAVIIGDRRETQLPPIGLVELEDAETGELTMIDTRDRRLRELFASQSRRHREELRRLLRESGVGEIDLWTDEPYVDAIVKFFRARERRR